MPFPEETVVWGMGFRMEQEIQTGVKEALDFQQRPAFRPKANL